MKIFKTKFYICRYDDNGKTLSVLPNLSFDTESRAFSHMFQPRAREEQDDPRFIRTERKPEFSGIIKNNHGEDISRHSIVKGDRILRNPDKYGIAK